MKSSRKPGLTFALVVAAVAAGLSPSLAADLPTRKSPPAPVIEAPAATDWSGFYFGGFAGGSLASASQGYSVKSTFLSTYLPSLIPYVNNQGAQELRGGSFDLGVEVGYNAKVGDNVYLGVAGDLRWGELNAGRTTSGTLPLVGLPYVINQKLSGDWRGSLRLRAGVSPVEHLLVYATGGPAFGHFRYAASFWDNLVPPFSPGTEYESVSLSALRAGWTLGAGADWALSRNWSVNAEYRYSEYAGFGGTGVLPLQQPPSTAYIGHSSGTIRENNLHIGVNYHFN